MKPWTDRVLSVLHALGAVLLALLTAVICYDVAGRMLFNRPFAGTAELTGAGLVLLTFLQAPHAMREGKLLRVTFLLERLPPAVAGMLSCAAWLVGAAVFATFVLAGWEPALAGWASGEFYGNDAFRLPAWPLRFGTLLLWALAVVVCLGLATTSLRSRASSRRDAAQDPAAAPMAH